MTGRPDTLVVDRFDIANAAFWLHHIACWLGDPDHAHQLAADLWDDTVDTGLPLTIIVGRSAAALRATLNADTSPGHQQGPVR